ncbi:SPOR domain-containing protein [Candidatus Omnitrophota bacterium]
MLNNDLSDQQAEFFENFPNSTHKQHKKRFTLGKVNLSCSYENLIIVSIGLIMTLLVCYSLGVEKGKRLAQAKDLLIPEVAEQTKPAVEHKTTEPKKVKPKVKVAQAKEKINQDLPYIQVASFRTDKYAQKEMQRLKEKGFSAYALDWGTYKVVCVGGYDNKNQANLALKQLKTMYADCILRNR